VILDEADAARRQRIRSMVFSVTSQDSDRSFETAVAPERFLLSSAA